PPDAGARSASRGRAAGRRRSPPDRACAAARAPRDAARSRRHPETRFAWRRCCTVLTAVSTAPHAHAAALRACWHPVAYAADVARAPRAITLLDEPVVLWRDARGVPHVFRDVCVHRGTALSLGCVEGDELVCAYHGWRYRGDGACAAIPQLADPTRVPARARAFVYTAQERYGIVWAALEPPARPLQEVLELDDPAWRAVRTGPVARDRCVGYCVVARNYNLEQPDDVIQAFERTIFGQDQRVVESQRPARVPFDVAAELHLTFDAVAVAYRRAMRAHGFGSA